MANANNMAATRPRASFQRAGGTIFTLRHPFLTGALGSTGVLDEVDVSHSLQLNSNFFQANPAQDSATQEVLVDGSVITVTNHAMNGIITLQALQTTGFVGTGDFIACAQLIVASGDNVGGTFTVKRDFNDKRRIRVYFGIAFKRVPHELIAGSTIVPYPVEMFYTSWVEGLGATDTTKKTIWAVGNKYGISAEFGPYKIGAVGVDSVDASGTAFTGVGDATNDTAVSPTVATYPAINAAEPDATQLAAYNAYGSVDGAAKHPAA